MEEERRCKMRKSVTGDLEAASPWHDTVTRWSWSFSPWQDNHEAFLYDKVIMELHHGSQHYCKGMIINTFLLNWERFLWTQGKCMYVCVCACVCRSFPDLFFFLCAIGSTQVEHLQGCWCWWLISRWWWWWWWYTKDQIQKIEGFEIAITIPHQHSWRWLWAFGYHH